MGKFREFLTELSTCDSLIIFGRFVGQVKEACSIQEK